jgi:hypothetical protein
MHTVRILDAGFALRIVFHRGIDLGMTGDHSHILNGHAAIKQPGHQRPAEPVRVDVLHSAGSCKPLQHGANSAGQKALSAFSDKKRIAGICSGC